LWEKFASDYTDDCLDKEYNSFKHGFRAQIAGEPGPSIALTPSGAKEPVVLSSDFGTNFYVAEKLTEAADPQMGHHFKLDHYHVNLQPTVMVSALRMISISIKNVVAFLRLIDRPPPEGVQIMWPLNKEDFEIFSHSPRGGLARI